MASKRKQTTEETKLRRSQMVCRVFSIKVDSSKCNLITKEHLHRLFLEAKWFYNYILSNKDIKDASTTITSVPVKVKDIYEQREFTALTAQMKQSIKERTWVNLKSLSTTKKKGKKVGKLKFKSYVESIPLPAKI